MHLHLGSFIHHLRRAFFKLLGSSLRSVASKAVTDGIAALIELLTLGYWPKAIVARRYGKEIYPIINGDYTDPKQNELWYNPQFEELAKNLTRFVG